MGTSNAAYVHVRDVRFTGYLFVKGKALRIESVDTKSAGAEGENLLAAKAAKALAKKNDSILTL